MILGIWWLGNLLYPDLYDYDVAEVAQEIYKLFWNYDLSEEEAASMLSHSTLKRDGLSG
jgi:iron complex transport system substrate-binding protein